MPLSIWVLDPANLTPFYSLALCKGLAEVGQRVRFVTSEFNYDPAMALPPAVSIDYHYFRRLRGLQRRSALVRRAVRAAAYPLDHQSLARRAAIERPDIVHFQWSRMPWLDRRLIDRLHALAVGVVHTVHDVEPLFGASGGVSALARVYERCDALIVHTTANRAQLLERYPMLRPDRIHVIPHGPLQAETAPAGATKMDARQRLGLPANAPVALYFGTIKPYKGLDLLLAALPAASRRLPETWLLLAGRPAAAADVPDLDALQRQGIHVRAELGFIPNRDVWQYYLAADVVVLPYRSITQSGVLLTALAFGRPVIVTRVGGLPEIVQEAQGGWVVPAEDPAALAAALIEALLDRPRTEAIGGQAKMFIESEYDWRRIADRTVEVYQKVGHNPSAV